MSPIERMIDEACGYDPAKAGSTVMMECPKCGRTKLSWREPSDPPGTVKVVAICNECPEEATIVDYFNAQGQQIDWEGKPL